MLKPVLLVVIAFYTLFFHGCATVVNGNVDSVTISSHPSGANVAVYDANQKLIYTGATPAQLSLASGNGEYFGRTKYHVVIEKSGYGSMKYEVQSRLSLWYVFGNLFTLGVGYFVWDPNGAMYRLSPKSIVADIKETRFFSKTRPGLPALNVSFSQP